MMSGLTAGHTYVRWPLGLFTYICPAFRPDFSLESVFKICLRYRKSNDRVKKIHPHAEWPDLDSVVFSQSEDVLRGARLITFTYYETMRPFKPT